MMDFAKISRISYITLGIALRINLFFYDSIVDSVGQGVLVSMFPGLYSFFYLGNLSNVGLLLLKVYLASLIINIVVYVFFVGDKASEEKAKKKLIKKLRKEAKKRYKDNPILDVDSLEKGWWTMTVKELENLLKLYYETGDRT